MIFILVPCPSGWERKSVTHLPPPLRPKASTSEWEREEISSATYIRSVLLLWHTQLPFTHFTKRNGSSVGLSSSLDRRMAEKAESKLVTFPNLIWPHERPKARIFFFFLKLFKLSVQGVREKLLINLTGGEKDPAQARVNAPFELMDPF